MTSSIAIQADVTIVDSAYGLDQIIAYWLNMEPGQGMVTITCYGNAWTAYFGSMYEKTIQEFFAGASVEYLTGKMGISQVLKQRKQDTAYLSKIISAVRDKLSS